MDRPARSNAAAGIRELLEASIAVKQAVLATQTDAIAALAETIAGAIRSGGTLFLCGNGGSAADAQHLAAELLVRLRPGVPRNGVPAIALAGDTSSLTAWSNDYTFEEYYERLVRTLCRPGDLLLAISTSGRSPNVVRALVAARECGLTTAGLLGGDGGTALAQCDEAIVVPSDVVGRVQEAHIAIGHALLEAVEDDLLASGHVRRT